MKTSIQEFADLAAPGRGRRKQRRPDSARSFLTALLREVDVEIAGVRPWDIRVHDERFFSRVVADGSLGFGESYMERWWECDDLEEMCSRVIRGRLTERVRVNGRLLKTLAAAYVVNLQDKRGARKVAEQHYDLGNEFFEAMLDPAMQYSCGYWRGAANLQEAQLRKMDLICRKLQLRPGMRLLDIGCGWGGLARFAAREYGCQVVGVTISKEQQEFGMSHAKELPVEIRLQDYRDISETFDRIVSVGMLEHVGPKNHRHFMQVAAACLEEEGLFLCHTIGDTCSTSCPDPWIERYIFPNSQLPSASQVTRAAEELFVLEDVHNFGADYEPTLLAWEEKFRRSWERFGGQYGERFYRMWRFYLLSCAAAFRVRSIELYQFLFSKGGVPGGYRREEIELAR